MPAPFVKKVLHGDERSWERAKKSVSKKRKGKKNAAYWRNVAGVAKIIHKRHSKKHEAFEDVVSKFLTERKFPETEPLQDPTARQEVARTLRTITRHRGEIFTKTPAAPAATPPAKGTILRGFPKQKPRLSKFERKKLAADDEGLAPEARPTRESPGVGQISREDTHTLRGKVQAVNIHQKTAETAAKKAEQEDNPVIRGYYARRAQLQAELADSLRNKLHGTSAPKSETHGKRTKLSLETKISAHLQKQASREDAAEKASEAAKEATTPETRRSHLQQRHIHLRMAGKHGKVTRIAKSMLDKIERQKEREVTPPTTVKATTPLFTKGAQKKLVGAELRGVQAQQRGLKAFIKGETTKIKRLRQKGAVTPSDEFETRAVLGQTPRTFLFSPDEAPEQTTPVGQVQSELKGKEAHFKKAGRRLQNSVDEVISNLLEFRKVQNPQAREIAAQNLANARKNAELDPFRTMDDLKSLALHHKGKIGTIKNAKFYGVIDPHIPPSFINQEIDDHASLSKIYDRASKNVKIPKSHVN